MANRRVPPLPGINVLSQSCISTATESLPAALNIVMQLTFQQIILRSGTVDKGNNMAFSFCKHESKTFQHTDHISETEATKSSIQVPPH